MPLSQFIVAEVVKNWRSEADIHSGLLSQRFEEVIRVNFQRGYVLKDWKLSRLVESTGINETIIAVFEKIEPNAK